MKTFLTLIFCGSALLTFAQVPGDLPPNAEAGRCYAKCLIADSFETYEIEVPVYIGDPDDKTVKRKKKKIILSEKSTKWVKKKKKGKCLSKDPEDCLVWCMAEIPEVSVEREVVLDLSKTEFYIMETFDKVDLQTKGGYTEWREIICAKHVNADLIGQIQDALYYEGFLKTPPRMATFDSETKEALKLFQRENALPIGNLDLETLDALNINY